LLRIGVPALHVECHAHRIQRTIVRRVGLQDGFELTFRHRRLSHRDESRRQATQRHGVAAPPGQHVAELGCRFLRRTERKIGLAEPQLGLQPIGLGLQGPSIERQGGVEVACLARLVGLSERRLVAVPLAGRSFEIEATCRCEQRQARAENWRQLHSYPEPAPSPGGQLSMSKNIKVLGLSATKTTRTGHNQLKLGGLNSQ
jgi:hypothetical protein